MSVKNLEGEMCHVCGSGTYRIIEMGRKPENKAVFVKHKCNHCGHVHTEQGEGDVQLPLQFTQQ